MLDRLGPRVGSLHGALRVEPSAMPEGPEIRRAADRLERALVGRELVGVRFTPPDLAPYADDLVGARVESVRPRGKALLTRFDTGRVLYSHNQLYGRWYVVGAGKPPRTGRALRVALETASKWALLYSASDIELLYADEVEQHPFIAKLGVCATEANPGAPLSTAPDGVAEPPPMARHGGEPAPCRDPRSAALPNPLLWRRLLGPDVLDEGTPPRVIAARLASKRFARRSLGALLLDQAFVAGLGNYLRIEILFFAGLHPSLRPCDLSADRQKTLARLIRSITQRAYTTGGVTQEPAAAARAKAEGEPRQSWRHAVFGRAGAPCRRCGEAIERIEVGTRRLYLCAVCQG